MLKTQPLWAIFLLNDKENVTKYLDHKMKFQDFSMISTIFLKIHDFYRPGKCIFKLDFLWQREPWLNISLDEIQDSPNLFGENL